MKRRASEHDDWERSRRPLRPTRTRYDKNRLLHELQHLCPEALACFPNALSFHFLRADGSDGSDFRTLEIGRVWSRNADKGMYEMGPEALLVIDKGAYHSGPPELVPYTGRGESQRHIVNADGFTGSGVFAEFRECHGNPFVNPRLDDPVISSLIQFIFIIRDMRRYYYYYQADDVPSSVHLATLTQALHVATIRARLAMRGPVSQPRGGEAQGMQQLQVTIEPSLRTKRVVLVPTSRSASNRAITNGDTVNVVTTNGVTANGFTTNGAMTNGTMTNGARASSEASSHATDDQSYS